MRVARFALLSVVPAGLFVVGCALPPASLDEDVPEGDDGSGGSGKGGSVSNGGSAGKGGSSGSGGSGGSSGSAGAGTECDPARATTPRSTEYITCEGAQGCYFNGDDNYVCATAGTLVPGDTCEFINDCIAGHYCTVGGECREYCLDDSDCNTSCRYFSEPAYAGSREVGSCLTRPDLAVTAWGAQSYQVDGGAYFCLNRTPQGVDEVRGESIEVSNLGEAAVPSGYQVAIGLLSESTGEQYTFTEHFTSDGSHAGESSLTWSGPYCVGADLAAFPVGDYRFFVQVDDTNVVNESNEDNNYNISSSIFTIGAGPAPEL